MFVLLCIVALASAMSHKPFHGRPHNGMMNGPVIEHYELKAKRDAMFEKSLPGLEKATDILSAKDFSSMRPDDKDTYHDALTALKQIYAVQNKSDKVTDVVKKLKKFEE